MADRKTHPDRPLEGIRVVDIATFIAGPFAACLLADFGAEVIKAEMPGEGDSLRQMGPVYNGGSFWWSVDNRNKKCITLDLRKPKGQEIVKRLVEQADVLVENFRPGTLERWGIGYDVLSRVNPRLVMARISAFGQTGPYRERPGFATVADAMGGLQYMTGFPDLPPIRPGMAVPDYLTGVFTAFAIMMAIHYRDKTGRGQYIDSALYESIFRITEYTAGAYGKLGQVRERTGISRTGAPGSVYQTSDGKWVGISTPNDRLFTRLAAAMDRAELATDPRYATGQARMERREETNGIVADWVAKHTAKEVVDKLEQAEVPCAPVYSIADIFADPHYQAREMVATVDDPVLGEINMPGVVPKMSLTPGRIAWSAPPMGAHNEEVYCGLLGYSAEELERLKVDGVV